MTAEKCVLGRPEAVTPCSFKPESQIPIREIAPEDWGALCFEDTGAGFRVELPLEEGTHVFGFGLQLHRFDFTGGKA